jgi:hypothetical protein
VDDRHGDHPLDAFPISLRGEWREVGTDRIVGHPLGTARSEDATGESDPGRNDEAVDGIGPGLHRMSEHDVAGVVELADPRHIDADRVGKAGEDGPEGGAPIEQAENLGIVLVELHQEVDGRRRSASPPVRGAAHARALSAHIAPIMHHPRGRDHPCPGVSGWRPPGGGLHAQLP